MPQDYLTDSEYQELLDEVREQALREIQAQEKKAEQKEEEFFFTVENRVYWS